LLGSKEGAEKFLGVVSCSWEVVFGCNSQLPEPTLSPKTTLCGQAWPTLGRQRKDSACKLEEVVRDSFERLPTLFAEVGDTTAAAFTDEIQRTVRRELQEYNEELTRSTSRQRTELSRELSAEQEAFLTRFQTALGGVLQAGAAEAQKTALESFASLLEQRKSMTDSHRLEMQRVYDRLGEQAAERHKNRLENSLSIYLLAVSLVTNGNAKRRETKCQAIPATVWRYTR